MPLRKNNTRSINRKLYAGEIQTVRMLVREDDQREAVVRSCKIFNARQKIIQKVGEPIQGEMSSNEHCVWQFESAQLKRNGINYVNVLTRIVDARNRYWQPESKDPITLRLFENEVFVSCVRVDPPSPPAPAANTGIPFQELT